jgi:hypothetical protein
MTTEEATVFLKDLATKMSIQNNVWTQDVWFVVIHKVWHPSTLDIWYDKRIRKDDCDYDDLCGNCKKLYDNYEELLDSCNDCDDTQFRYTKYEEEIDTRAWIFLTSEACKKHIEENGYHYSEPRVYWVSFWRNEEMKQLINAIFSIANIEQPNHYSKI